MPVQIEILSGPRQGERLGLEADEFRAGGEASCEIFFDPAAHPGAAQKLVTFRLDEDGWRASLSGAGEALVNDRLLAGSTKIRSGDILRLSPQGPDFLFAVVPKLPPEIKAVPALASLTERGSSAAPVDPLPRSPPGSASPASPPPAPPAALASGNQIRPAGFRKAAWGAAVLAALVLFALTASWALREHADSPEARSPDAGSIPAAAAANQNMAGSRSETGDKEDEGGLAEPYHQSAAPGSVEIRAGAGEPSSDERPPAENVVTSDDPWLSLADRLRDAVLLLLVEDPSRRARWPFATCCAIGEDSLLTTATVGTELARFRSLGWRVLAVDPGRNREVEVNEVRVHKAYALSDDPETRIYFDVALLGCAAQLPTWLELPTPEDLGEVEAGRPLGVLEIPHDGEPMNRFRSYEVGLARGRAFLVTSLPPSPGGPRLLHFRASLGAHVHGSPVVNEKGRVVAVYSESSALGGRALGLALHYATVVPVELIQLALEGKSDLWVVPEPTAQAEPAAEDRSQPSAAPGS